MTDISSNAEVAVTTSEPTLLPGLINLTADTGVVSGTNLPALGRVIDNLALNTNLKVGPITGKATTQRMNFPFTSMCKFGNTYLCTSTSK